MMLSNGIPELRSHEDVKYLRETLCLDLASEDEAADNFSDEVCLVLCFCLFIELSNGL